MSLITRKIAAFAKKVADLADKPNLGSTALLKQQFDSSPEELRVALNGIIDDLTSTTAGSSGAKNLGATTITDLAGTDVQTLLESLRNALKSVTSGASGSDFVSSAAIAGLNGATIYPQLVSLKALIDAVFTKAQLQSTAAGTSGTEVIGSAPISGVAGATPFAQIADLKSQLNGVVLNQIPNDTITMAKFAYDVRIKRLYKVGW